MNKLKELKYLLLVFVVFIAACIETDIYLPAFPDMMLWFKATEGSIQKLLTWNFIGICISGPLYGPLSDAFGRKKPLMIALGMFLAGSLLTVFSTNLDQMLWGRILQGLGSGGCFTLGMAIIFDAYNKEKAINATNQLNTFIPLLMAIAPMIGGYLNHAFGFRSNFIFIAAFVLISFLICLIFLDESLEKEKRTNFAVKSILKDFKQAFCCVPFWQLSIIMSLTFAAYITFLSGTSVLFILEFGMSKAIFPLVQALVLAGWVSGSLLLTRSINRWGIAKIKRIGIICCIAGGVILALSAIIAPRDPYLPTIGMIIFSFGANWTSGLYFPEGMEILPHIKGIAASLLTSARLLISAGIVGLASALYNSTIYPLTAVVIASICIMLPLIYFYEKGCKARQSSTN